MFSFYHRTVESKNTALRAAAANAKAEMANVEQLKLKPRGKASVARLRVALDDLVTALSLKGEPVLRACPNCHELGRQEARRCGYCWAEFDPVEAAAAPTALPVRDTSETDRIIGEDMEPSMYNDHLDHDVTIHHHQRPW